jgi:Type IV secretion system pilin
MFLCRIVFFEKKGMIKESVSACTKNKKLFSMSFHQSLRLFLFGLVSVVSFSVIMSGAPAWAVTCPPDYADTTGSGVCFPTTSGLSQAGVDYLLINLMQWLLGIFGTLAVIAFVISGVQYLTSAGDDDMISTAKRNMKYSIIGVIVALSGYVILTAVIRAFSGTTTTF